MSLRIVIWHGLVYALGLLCPSQLYAQDDERYPLEDSWRWVRFGQSSGLPSNRVYDVIEAPDGTPWAWSETGIAWYDGFRWRGLGSVLRGMEMTTSRFHGFMRDKLVVRIGGRVGLVDTSGIELLPMHDVSDIMVNGGDSLLFRKADRLFLYLHCEAVALKPPPWFNSQGKPYAAYPDRRRYFSGPGGLYRISGRKHENLLETNMRGLGIIAISVNSGGEGVVLINSPVEMQGTWEWDLHKGAKMTPIRSHRIPLHTAISEDGYAVVLHEDGMYSTRSDGSWCALRRLRQDLNDVHRIRFAKNGDLWVATNNGLFLCRLSSVAVRSFQWPENDKRNRINDIIRDRNGNVWCATSGGIVRISPDGAERRWTRILGTRFSVVTGVCEDNEGGIWICSGVDFSGAFRWDGRQWFKYETHANGRAANIHRIFRGRGDRLWFAGISPDYTLAPEDNPGVFVWERAVLRHWEHSDGLPHSRVYAVNETSDGTLWFGTYNGVGKFRDGQWTMLAQGARPGWRYVMSITPHSDGNVYFGMAASTARGLGVIDAQENVRYVDVADGLPDNKVWEVKSDADGRLWVASGNGLGCMQNGDWTVYREQAGLPSASLWPLYPCGDSLYVGTSSSGWVRIDISKLRTSPPRIDLDAPIVEGREVLLSWTPLLYYGGLEPNQVYCRYRMDSGEWSRWLQGRTIKLSDAAYGAHSFHIQARGLHGEYDVLGSSLEFYVPYPPILRWYILGPLLVLLTVLIYLSVRYIRGKIAYNSELRRSLERYQMLNNLLVNNASLNRELQHSEQRYRMTTELMSDFAFGFDVSPNGSWSVQWMTESYSRLTGYSLDESRYTGFIRKFIIYDDFAKLIESRRSVNQGLQVHIEYRVRTKSGSVLWLESELSPVKNPESGVVTQVYGIARDITQRKASSERLRCLAGDLVQTEERERRRMATFLHDVISQSIALAYLKLHRWQKRAAPDDAALDEVRGMLDHVIEDAHTLTFDLCPPIIHELNLAEAITWQVRQLQRQHGVELLTSYNGIDVRVDPELHVLLFRAVRELIVNALKHAQALHIRVEVQRDLDMVILRVIDDGVGFPTGQSDAGDEEDRGGFGLRNIRRRLSDFGIDVVVESTPREGSAVSLCVPLGLIRSLSEGGGDGILTTDRESKTETESKTATAHDTSIEETT
ncbi:MAG: PAS domain-containing protein [Bacteroidia bacterium]|nr:PAS domain-containing protein [Bacteroidia bacterium]